MPNRDQRIDAYIARSAGFARPILTRLREIVHAACPDVEETIRWGMPSFSYHGILCNMAAFRHHATFGFWKAERVVDARDTRRNEAMGSFGRLTTLADLPSQRILARYIRTAMQLNVSGVTSPKPRARPAAAKRAPAPPADLLAALRRRKGAIEHFRAFPPGQRKEYADWIADAKTDATRRRRIATAAGWIAEGKRRNWKYERRADPRRN